MAGGPPEQAAALPGTPAQSRGTHSLSVSPEALLLHTRVLLLGVLVQLERTLGARAQGGQLSIGACPLPEPHLPSKRVMNQMQEIKAQLIHWVINHSQQG